MRAYEFIFEEDNIPEMIDGRPTRNNQGKLIHNTIEGIKNFWRWFGDSKVVDDQGRPLVVYHGTTAKFDVFDKQKVGSNTGWGNTIHGFFFIGKEDLATNFANQNNLGGNVNIKSTYLSIKKPIDLRLTSFFNLKSQASHIVEFFTNGEELLDGDDAIEWLNDNIDMGEWAEIGDVLHTTEFNSFLASKGYDGLISNFGDDNAEYVAFMPNQIKSVTRNTGHFSTSSNNITEDTKQIPEMINDRPTRNSQGKLIHNTIEGIKNFWRWFGDSKVVDNQGRPLVVYHGTGGDFNTFDKNTIGKNDSGWYGRGFYFTPHSHWTFAQDAAERHDGSANIMPVYLNIKKPMYGDAYAEQGSNLVASAIDRGMDGVIVNYSDGHEYANQIAEIIAVSPNQIKSAIGNKGTFSKSSNITEELDNPELKKWFGKSKIVDENGNPKVVYHGTSADFDIFQKPEVNRMADRSAVGFWFTSSKEDAQSYGKHLKEVFLKMVKPRRITRRKLDELAVSYPLPEMMAKLKSGGCDGLIIEAIKPDPIMDEKGMPEQYVVFNADQIKNTK